MIHIQVGIETPPKFFCDAGTLPPGDRFFFVGERGGYSTVDCPGCRSVIDAERLGVPLSELSGRPGHPGFDAYTQIAETWGFE